jgi:hypothetical protein
MCGTMQRTLKIKNKSRKGTQVKFYKVIAAPMLMYGSENWALNRSERRKIEKEKMHFLRAISGCTLTDHVRITTTCNALQIYAIKESPRLQKQVA